MTLALYGHPFSSYTWKALIALYANGTDFEFREIDLFVRQVEHGANVVQMLRRAALPEEFQFPQDDVLRRS